MARLRKIEISNFRCIKSLSWAPPPGLNCLIGPGDSGKSTILDAIDLCLGARRTAQFTDADFFNLDVETPIEISVTIGELDDSLKNLDTYGLYLRGFDSETGVIEDEPESECEAVLTLNLTVSSDLEPVWSLISERAREQGSARNLTWSDRIKIAPTRIGSVAENNLSWRRGSVLNQLTDEKADSSAALAKAARIARGTFGDQAENELTETLRIVTETAKELGIPIGNRTRALLDAHSVTFSGGAISLHDEWGVPLKEKGTGSTRLLIAGLQRRASRQSSILLADEMEYGLEPHRIIRFLDSIGSKEKFAPLQVFLTTHSPVVLQELNGDQLFVLRSLEDHHEIVTVGRRDDIQSTIRIYPEAFLARSIIVCEGASEVGFLRGVDQHRLTQGFTSIRAGGVALVDCGGGEADKPFKRACVFRKLGIRTAILRDDDLSPSDAAKNEFDELDGKIFSWRDGRTLEDDLFLCMPDNVINEMVRFAVELHGDATIDGHLRSASNGTFNLAEFNKEFLLEDKLSEATKIHLGKASRTKRAGWYKSVSWMEELAREVIAPHLADADDEFGPAVGDIFDWANQ